MKFAQGIRIKGGCDIRCHEQLNAVDLPFFPIRLVIHSAEYSKAFDKVG